MKFDWNPNEGALRGRYIFLSASVPQLARHQKYLAGPLEPRLMLRLIETRVHDAVVSLVTQILRTGGRVVFGGQPAITPMVAQAVTGWNAPEPIEPPVALYQSVYFDSFPEPPGRAALLATGLARMVKTNLDVASLAARLRLPPSEIGAFLREQAPPEADPRLAEALLCLRLQMLAETRPIATICIGGMEGIEAEARLYRRIVRETDRNQPARLFVLRSTFGAAANLDDSGAISFDQRYLQSHNAPEDRHPLESDALRPSEEVAAEQLENPVRYDPIMEALVRELAELPPPEIID